MSTEAKKDAQAVREQREADRRAAQQAAQQRRVVQAPGVMVPPRFGGAFGRPTGMPSMTQRQKRQQVRGSVVGRIKDATVEAGVGEMLLYGLIDPYWGISAESFNEELQTLGAISKLRLRVNSGGGDVFEATAIYSMLVKADFEVVIEIEGVAASAATLISMAGDEIHISENAHFMIHAASGFAWGNAAELRQYLKLLDNADELIRLTYSSRTGIDVEELSDMMSFDNWMTAAEAKEHGFVDSIDEAKKGVKPTVEPGNVIAYGAGHEAISAERLEAVANNLLAMKETLGNCPGVRIAATAVTKGDGPKTDPQDSKQEPEMNPKLRAMLVACGMPESHSDAEAMKWMNDNAEKVVPGATTTQATTPVVTTGSGLTAEDVMKLWDAREERISNERKKWGEEVDATLALAFGDSIPNGLRSECLALQADGVTALRSHVQEAKKKDVQPTDVGGVRINFTPNQPRDQHLSALKSGVLVRALRNFVPTHDKLVCIDGKWERTQVTPEQILAKHYPEAERAKDYQRFEHMPLIKIAEHALICDGYSHDQVSRLSAPEMAMAAMGYANRARLSNSGAIHTTGSLLEITRDAINKSLLAGYDEAPQTWRGPMRQGASVSDFKDIHRVKLSAASNLPVWNDNAEPEEAKLSNEKEKYAVEARAEKLSFSWRLLVNDDLNALSRYPQLLGDAAGRTVNAVAWAEITSNPVMADGKALFLATPADARKRSNLTTGAATPTNLTIGAMKAKMRKMRGLNKPDGSESDDILGLVPFFIACGSDLEETVLKQVFSGADPAAGGNSAVYNSSRTLTPIIEPLLDAASATAWYLFASPSRIDTVEVTFLAGQETPYTHEWMDDATMSQNYTIMQTFAAKAIDHRGMQKHDGA